MINENTSSDSVNDSGTQYFSQAMTGTETLGTGGSVASGSDIFSWTETASDMEADKVSEADKELEGG